MWSLTYIELGLNWARVFFLIISPQDLMVGSNHGPRSNNSKFEQYYWSRDFWGIQGVYTTAGVQGMQKQSDANVASVNKIK